MNQWNALGLAAVWMTYFYVDERRQGMVGPDEGFIQLEPVFYSA